MDPSIKEAVLLRCHKGVSKLVNLKNQQFVVLTHVAITWSNDEASFLAGVHRGEQRFVERILISVAEPAATTRSCTCACLP